MHHCSWYYGSEDGIFTMPGLGTSDTLYDGR